jgi:hypothetical protein
LKESQESLLNFVAAYRDGPSGRDRETLALISSLAPNENSAGTSAFCIDIWNCNSPSHIRVPKMVSSSVLCISITSIKKYGFAEERVCFCFSTT